MNSFKSLPSFVFSDNNQVRVGWDVNELLVDNQDNHQLRVGRDVNEMPVVFLPETSDLECVAQNRMSSFGFLAFIVQSVNAVVNVANNINNNNNNRNNNNNDNNNNQVNTNIANSANDQSSNSGAGMGRGLVARMREARDRVLASITGDEAATEDEVETATEAALIDKDEYRKVIERRVNKMMAEMYKMNKMEDPVKNVSSSSYPREILSMMEDVS